MLLKDTLLQSVDDLGTSYSAITSPKTALLSMDPEEEWKHNERPLNAMAIQKDRKRYPLVLTFLFCAYFSGHTALLPYVSQMWGLR